MAALAWLAYLTFIPLRRVGSDQVIAREIILLDSAGRPAGWLTMADSLPGLKLMLGRDQLVGLGFDGGGEPHLSLYGRRGDAVLEMSDSVRLDLDTR